MTLPGDIKYLMSRALLGCVFIVSVTLIAVGTPRAQGLPIPTSPVLLTVDGNIGVTNVNGKAEFDRGMLEALGMQSIVTTNPFETGTHTFEGVLVRDILKAVDANGGDLAAVALDGYSVKIPVEDVLNYPVMLAMVWNGKAMKVRNRGPLWVIYPIEKYTELQDQKYSARSIWQLKKLTVE